MSGTEPLPAGAAPDDDRDPDEDVVDALFARYVIAREEGRRPETVSLAAQLESEDQRRRFLAMITEYDGLQREVEEPVRPGAHIADRYQIEELLAQGGMGKVFKAFDDRLQRPVAVKMLTVARAGRLDAEALARQEGILMAGLRHPNIVPVFEILQVDGACLLVMELVEGTSLDQVLRRLAARTRVEGRPALGPDLLRRAVAKPLPAGRHFLVKDEDDWATASARIILELARTVEAAHAAGVLHRDLKPPNVMLRGDAHPVVLDFGLSASRDESEDPLGDGLFGTAAYVAPEQATSGLTGCDPRTDVYQLGLLLYEMLTLERAFPGSEVLDVLDDVAEGRRKPLSVAAPDVPEALRTIAERALTTNPDMRVPTVAALREELEGYLTTPPSSGLIDRLRRKLGG